MNGHDILVYLSLKYEGNWDKIFDAVKRRERFDFETANEELKKVTAKTLTCIDPDYPEVLKHTYHPPFVLYYYGDISLLSDKKKKLAMIGSRIASDYGTKTSYAFARDLAKGFVIVSGLAKGIDTTALKGALDAGEQVIAVLGSGIDNCYPLENQEIYEEIKENHLLISEYPLMTPPNDFQFPLRNRLIASFSDAVLVVEAKKRSGTLITVGHALSLGKEIFCIPHRVGESFSTNSLIRDGAYLVESPKDLFNHFEITFE